MAHMKKNNIKCTAAELNAVLDPKLVMQSYNVLGSTGPKATAAMIEKMNQQLADARNVLKADQARVKKAYDVSRAIAGEMKLVENADDIAAIVKRHGIAL
jgi:hypothetical protein